MLQYINPIHYYNDQFKTFFQSFVCTWLVQFCKIRHLCFLCGTEGNPTLRHSIMALNNPNPGTWKVSSSSQLRINQAAKLTTFSLAKKLSPWPDDTFDGCVLVHASVCARCMCILHVCICTVCRSQFMTRTTSRGSVWSLPQRVRTSWSAASATSAPWRWSVARESNPEPFESFFWHFFFVPTALIQAESIWSHYITSLLLHIGYTFEGC